MDSTTPNKAEAFVSYILKKCEESKGTAARLRRADNRDTEDQCYNILVPFGIDIEKDWERMPYLLIAAALARLQEQKDGSAKLGQALKSCFEDGDQGDMRIRRLLACTSQEEVCQVLRPLLRLIQSKASSPVSYSLLLKDLLYFPLDAQRIRLRWANEYYGYNKIESEKEVE